MRRPGVRVRPLTGLLLLLLVATSAVAWKQSRSSQGLQPLLFKADATFSFRYRTQGVNSAGMAASHTAWDNARAMITALPTSTVTANRGADMSLADPVGCTAPVAPNGVNFVFGYTVSDCGLPMGVLAFAAAFHNTTTGAISECDVGFNDADFDWNTTDPDLEGVATHEFIHCYGISHSAVTGNFNSSGHEVFGDFSGDFSQHATMFPFHSGTTNDRSLHADDIAALGDLNYANATTAASLGTISGIVTDGGGNPVVGAHVVAVSTAAPNTPVVGFFSNTDVTSGGTGAYRLLVPPGNYFVRVEPIIGFPNRFRQANLFHPVTFRSNFSPEFYSGVNESANDPIPGNVQSDAAAVTVMAGQSTSGINIVVNNLAAFTHDNFANPRVISTNTFAEAVDTTLATTEGTDPTGSCFAEPRDFTVWYSFTAPACGNVTFSTEGSHYDTAVAAFTGSPGSFSQVTGACSEDLGTPFQSNVQSKITFAATAGTTYHFLVSDSHFLSVNPPEFLLVANFSVEPNPVPALSFLSNTSRAVGDTGFALTVNGSNFSCGSVVRWNGSNRTTSFINANQLQATIPSSDLMNAGTAQVTVFNPAPGGGTSSVLNFNIFSPVIAGLVPDTIPATSPGFELAVSGSNFHAGSVVRWNGMARTTMFVSSTQLKATIPNTDVTAVGTAQVTVLNSAGAGGVSNARTFAINIRNPLPTITGLSPAGAIVNSGAFTLTVLGSNFVFDSVVRIGPTGRTTTFVNGSQLQAAILAGDITTLGPKSITVFSSQVGGGGGTSNAAGLSVQAAPNPAPVTTSLNPNVLVAGSVRDTQAVQVNGTGSTFINGSVVRWNGMNRLTSFNNPNQLTATIPASDLVAAGTAQVTVFTPVPGGGTSNFQPFFINNPPPTLAAISPSSAPAGEPGLILIVTGSNFVPGSVVRWNGVSRPTTFIGSSQLRAAIPASDLAGPGMATVTVFTPAPPMGGQTSTGQTFTITSSVLASSTSTEGAPAPRATASATTAALMAAARPQPSAAGASRPAVVLLEREALEPRTIAAGSAEFTLTVRGKEFRPDAVIRWNGKELPTKFVSRSELEAVVPAQYVGAAGSARVTVFYPESGLESQPKAFTITPR